jgi:Cu-Zn family superoxide dismutase
MVRRNAMKLGLLALALSACNEPGFGQLGAACPNDRNCVAPLKCIEGTCQMAPEVPDAGEIADTGTPPDTGMPPDTGVVDTGMPDTGVPEYEDQFASGPLSVTPDGMTLGYAALTGRAGMIRETTGYTSVLIFASGLNPNADYGAHVHAKACADEGGGPHYKIDTAIMDVVQTNEIWPAVTSGPDGEGVGYLRVDHYAREDALSVVIHQTGGLERIACADLTPDAEATATGTFFLLPAGMGSGISGTARLRRHSGGTVATVELMGTFTSTSPYPVHVHSKRCDDEMGGPHYKIDPEVMGAVEANEIWPDAIANGNVARGSATTRHIARYDAWSMVVHDPVSGDRWLCADLKW